MSKKNDDEPGLEWEDVDTLAAVKAMRHAFRPSGGYPKTMRDLTSEERTRERSFLDGAEWAWAELTARIKYRTEKEE